MEALRRLLPLAAVAAFLLAGCADDAPTASETRDAPATTASDTTDAPATSASDTTDAPATTASNTTDASAASTSTAAVEETFPVEVASAGGSVTISARPERIVSISPTATEMLFAIGAGDQVEAVDELSYYPEEAPVTDLSGFEPNVEAILGFEPDLVVLSAAGDVVAGLDAAGVPSLVLPAAMSMADTYTQIEQLGVATGHVGDAAELVGQMQAEIDTLAASVPDRDLPLTYYHELDEALFSVTSGTFIGELYALAGLVNVADEADVDGAAGGYPQLSAEYLLAADPDLIFLADSRCCGQNAQTLAQRPGFDQLTALRQGNVVELDDDVASRWGPRVVELFRSVVEATVAVPEPAG